MSQNRLFQPPPAAHRQVDTSQIRPWRSTGRNNVRQSIKALGNLSAPLLREISDPQYRFEVIDGARRLDVLTSSGPVVIDALVLPLETRDEDARAATAALNLNRAPNPMEEARSFASLTQAGYELKQIAAELGISAQQIKSRLQLLKLPEAIQRAVEEKRVAPGVAAKASRLPAEEMGQLANRLVMSGRLTAKDVEEARRVRREEAVAGLPSELFAPREVDAGASLRSALEHAIENARSQGLSEADIQTVLLELGRAPIQSAESVPAYA